MSTKLKTLLNQAETETLSAGVIGCKADLQFALSNRFSADIFEWRVDHLMGAEVAAGIKKLRRPIILTVRDYDEGGKDNSWDDSQRIDLFHRYANLATMLDVEAINLSVTEPVIKATRHRFGAGLIVSCHCFEMKGALMKIDNAALSCRNIRGDILKLACMADTLDDLQKFTGYYVRTRRRNSFPVAAMAMGKFGKVSRIMFGLNKTPLIYGFLAKPLVEGQPHVSEIPKLLADYTV